MLEAVGTVTLAMSLLAALAALASVAAAFSGRWLIVRMLARVSVLTVALLVPTIIIAFLVVGVGLVATADASSKATALAKIISEAMNCGVPAFPSLLVGTIMWIVASRRMRRGNLM